MLAALRFVFFLLGLLCVRRAASLGRMRCCICARRYMSGCIPHTHAYIHLTPARCTCTCTVHAVCRRVGILFRLSFPDCPLGASTAHTTISPSWRISQRLDLGRKTGQMVGQCHPHLRACQLRSLFLASPSHPMNSTRQSIVPDPNSARCFSLLRRRVISFPISLFLALCSS